MSYPITHWQPCVEVAQLNVWHLDSNSYCIYRLLPDVKSCKNSLWEGVDRTSHKSGYCVNTSASVTCVYRVRKPLLLTSETFGNTG